MCEGYMMQKISSGKKLSCDFSAVVNIFLSRSEICLDRKTTGIFIKKISQHKFLYRRRL